MGSFKAESMEDKRCTKKRCYVPHSWWSRTYRCYFWCWGGYNR